VSRSSNPGRKRATVLAAFGAEFARALAQVAAESKASQPLVPARLSGWQALLGMVRGWTPALQFATGMAALALLVGATCLVVQNAAMRSG
jgi:hypothetical protein